MLSVYDYPRPPKLCITQLTISGLFSAKTADFIARKIPDTRTISFYVRILLCETDAFSSLPVLPDTIEVRCDSCGQAYSYKRSEISRGDVQVPESFVPHPLFKKTA